MLSASSSRATNSAGDCLLRTDSRHTLRAPGEDSLAGVRDVTAIFYVDSLDAFVPRLSENGAEILAGPRTVTGGKNATVRNPDGLIVEYFEAAVR